MNGFTLTRSIAATPERVWSAFTNADEYVAWIWPPEWSSTCEIDLRVGGAFRVASQSRGLAIHGTYRLVDPITRIVMSWTQTDREGDSLLTINIEPRGDRTELVLTHENFPDEVSRANHERGWRDCLGRLPGYLTEMPVKAIESPVAYVVSTVQRFPDAEAISRYAEIAGPAIARFGGRFLVSNIDPILVEGVRPTARMSVVEFPSLDQARAWYDSPEYAEARELTPQAFEGRTLLFVEGVSPI